MSRHETAPIPGWYIEFQANVLRQLPRPDQIDQATAEGWGGSQRSLKKFLNGLCPPELSNTAKAASVNIEYLTLLSGDQQIVIDSTDGNEVLAEAEDVFAYIDLDFRNWRADEKGPATKETPARVYELAKDATFSKMFNFASADLNQLCLTQAQIKGFAKKHRQWLRSNGYTTLFLFKSYDYFFVACVGVFDGGRLGADVDRFEDGCIWHAGFRSRVVLPQLA